jgi:hypothetical protein
MGHLKANSLPLAHTCFNSIEVPYYKSYETLCTKLRAAFLYGAAGYAFGWRIEKLEIYISHIEIYKNNIIKTNIFISIIYDLTLIAGLRLGGKKLLDQGLYKSSAPS